MLEVGNNTILMDSFWLLQLACVVLDTCLHLLSVRLFDSLHFLPLFFLAIGKAFYYFDYTVVVNINAFPT